MIIQEGRPRYFDAECQSEKRLKRKLERVAKKHPSIENRLAYKRKFHIIDTYCLRSSMTSIRKILHQRAPKCYFTA